MSAPKCPLCGVNHWQRDPHIWPDDPKPTKSPEKRPKPEPTRIVPVEPEKPSSDSERAGQVEYNKRWREKNQEQYREYMREYMKRRRQKAKQK